MSRPRGSIHYIVNGNEWLSSGDIRFCLVGCTPCGFTVSCQHSKQWLAVITRVAGCEYRLVIQPGR